jgi:hypothetical protein
LVPQQHQTFVNAKAEELLKAMATHSNLEFTSTVICELIVELEAPKL